MLDHNQMPDPIAKVFSVLLEKVESQQILINQLIEKQRKIENENTSDFLSSQLDNDRIIQEFIHGDGI